MAGKTESVPPAAGIRAEPVLVTRLRRDFGLVVAYLFLSLALLIAVVPFLWVILGSFKTMAELFLDPFLSLPKVVQWQNYADAWTQGRFGQYFVNSVIIAAPTVLLILFCGSLAGFAFARLKFHGSNIIFYMYLASMAISTNSIMIPLFHIVHSMGMLNTFLGVIVPAVGSHMPISSFIMRSFFKGLPKEIEDAARIDGCNDFSVFWKVMLPLARPALFALTIFTFMDSWNAFLLPLLFLKEESLRTIPLGLVVFKLQNASQYSTLFAGIVISFIPTLLLYVFLKRHFVRGLTVGSITG